MSTIDGQMARSSLTILCAITLSQAAVGQQPQPPRTPVEPVYPPRLTRPTVELSRAAFPPGVAGRLPTFDGENFTLTITERLTQRPTANQVRAFIDSVLGPLQWTREPQELQYVVAATGPGGDPRYVDSQVQEERTANVRRLVGRHGKVSGAVGDTLRAETDRIGEDAKQSTQVFRFDQIVAGVPIDNSGVRAVWREGRGLVSLSGRVFTNVTFANARQLDAQQARQAAELHITQSTSLAEANAPEPTLVILPYGSGMLYAWSMIITAVEGPYRLWIDAGDGRVLQLEPLFSAADPGRGLSFDPDPSGGTRLWNFEVDAPSGGVYRLRLTGALDVDNNGADGVCSGDLTINDDGSGQAAFDVAPINGTVVTRTSQTNYNCRFQDVNVFGWVSWLRSLWELMGSQPFGNEITATVNHNDPCGFGADNACASGTTSLQFGIGSATTSASTSCNAVFNSAIDATLIAHETGHLLNRLQFNVAGGTLPAYLNEGMADYWSHSTHNINTFAGWYGTNCAAPSQDSWFPRQAENTDVFPARLSTATFAHGRGQIVAWALWDTRREMSEANTLGALAFNMNLLTAMTTAGIGVQNGNQAQRIHNAYIDLITQLGNQYSTTRLMHKVLSGFARGGLLLSPADAVIDIDDDFLDRNDPATPTFTVWTGRDYGFNANETVNTGTQPCNTRFTVEVANDAAFTQNLVSSGSQSGINTGAGCFGTWTLPVADWNTLDGQDQIYYRATTTNATGGNVRTTGSPGNSTFVGVPAPKATINESGEEQCCIPTASATIAVLPVIVFGLFWRRRSNGK
jgi:hypothetical protein